jgi:hypothetical protein
MDLKIVAVARQEARPIPALRHRGWFVVWWPALLVGHLEEEQKRELLDVVAVGETVIPQDVAIVPKFLDELVGMVVRHGNARPLSSQLLLKDGYDVRNIFFLDPDFDNGGIDIEVTGDFDRDVGPDIIRY